MNVSKIKEEKLEMLHLFCLSNGWELKRSHYYKSFRFARVRLKVCKNVIRFEHEITHPATTYSPVSKSWYRMKSCLIKDLGIRNNKLTGFKIVA
jgi:hypothetical protein